MGTTATALASRRGNVVGFSLLIEGFEYILTNVRDVGPVLTAFASSAWDKALPGLGISGTIRRGIKPWQPGFDAPTLAFTILPDRADTFGKAVWKSRPSYRSPLTAIFQAAADGSGTINVKQTIGLAAAGRVFLGGKEMLYNAVGASSITVRPAGAQAHYPFDADGGNKFSVPHPVPEQKNWDQGRATYVSDAPKWIGRKVCLRIHRIVGGVWDTMAQAQVEFAGTIKRIRQGEVGATIIECEDLLGTVRDATLLKGQFVGYVKQGIRLNAGEFLRVGEKDGGHNITSTILTVKSSGASGNFEVNEGTYPLEDFLLTLNKALANDSDLNGKFTAELVSHDGAMRFRLSAKEMTSGSCVVSIYSNARHILEFLGFTTDQIVRRGAGLRQVLIASEGTTTELDLWSKGPPFRVRPFQGGRGFTERVAVELEDHQGAVIDATDFLPPPYDSHPDGGEIWSFWRIGDRLFFGRYASATKIDQLTTSIGFAGYMEGDGPDTTNIGLTVDDSGDRLEIRQVVILLDSFTEIMTRLLASTGGGINHATYDEFTPSMGCPGIPWSLLGSAYLNSAKRLDAALHTKAILVVLDRPTPLVDILPPELALRFAWLMWKDGGYRFVSPPLPNALTAEWTLDDTNKAAPATAPGGVQTSAFRTRVEVTSEFLRNIIAVNFNRTAGGKYGEHIVLRDEGSIADWGESEMQTIDAPNSFLDSAGTGTAVEHLSAALFARAFPAFGQPMKLIRRTIAPTLYGMAPGDTVSLSDKEVRNPTTGALGVTSRGCICLSVTHSYGLASDGGQGVFGETELLFTDEDRTYPLAPAAEVDTGYTGTTAGITFTNGYAATAAGGPALKLKAHEYGRAIDAVDVSPFGNSQKVRVVEVDPANPASVDAWERDTAAAAAVDTTNNILKLTTDLVTPSWSGSTKMYRVVPQKFSQVADSQKLVSYLADDGDGLIENLEQPNQYGEFNQTGENAIDPPTDLPELIAETEYAEGRPFHRGLFSGLRRTINNLTSYKAAPHSPFLWTTAVSITQQDYIWIFTVPWFVGGEPYKGARRYLKIAARLQTLLSAETASCRVTSSFKYPYGDSDINVKFNGATKSVTFTHTGDTLETTKSVQDLLVVMCDLWGFTYLTVELKTSSGAAFLRGFPTLHLGPLT